LACNGSLSGSLVVLSKLMMDVENKKIHEVAFTWIWEFGVMTFETITKPIRHNT